MKKLFILLITLSAYSGKCQDFDIYGPKPFGEILENSFTKSWTPTSLSSIDNLEYFILLDQATKSSAIILDESDISKLNVSDIESINETGATYSSLLRSMFQMVDINSNTTDDLSGKYQIRPVLHTYFALNYSTESDQVASTDVGTYYIEDAGESGYLVIEFDGSPSSIKLKASSQYTYNASSGSQEENSEWTTQWFVINGTSLTLTADVNSATTFFMANVRDLLDFYIDEGTDFNPGSINWQDNAFADYPEQVWNFEDSDFFSERFYGDLDDQYELQFDNTDDATTAATEALDEIETTLNEEGSSLRYNKSVYLAVRENMLSHTMASTDIHNGVLGERSVPHVYFTNAADDSGVHHPFMVIAAHAASGGPNFLIDVARPPGDGLNPGYSDQSITRNCVLSAFLFKIPLKDYGLIENLTDNELIDYGSMVYDKDVPESEYSVLNYVGPSSQGVAVDGVPIYPAFNNNLRHAPVDAEITSTGIHVGRGMNLHYHADGHGFNGNGINLYNIADYEDKDHPPFVGFGYDGILLFGRYESAFNEMAGYEIELDEYGGHDHDGFGYHYHAFSEEASGFDFEGNPISFTMHYLNVGAWKGNINDIPGFLEVKTNQLSNETYGRFAGATEESSNGSGNVLGFNINNSSVIIYPNPTAGSLKVRSIGITVVTITGLNGNIITSRSLDGITETVEFNRLPKGVYIVKGKGAKGSFTEKVFVK